MSASRKPETVNLTIKTKYIWLIIGVLLCLLAISPVIASYVPSSSSTGSGGSSAPPSSVSPNCANPCTISIKNSLFGTVQPIIVKAGTTVTWVNNDDTAHTTTSNNGLWNSGVMAVGASFSFTFSTAGTYPYHCNIHPMTGTIEVVS
jgi:hypothetical protein